MDSRLLVGAAAAVGVLLIAAAGVVPPQEPVRCQGCNVLVVSIDPLAAGHVGAYGYDRNTSPAIDRLASNSYVFNRTFTASTHTMPALYSTLTSTYVVEHGVVPSDSAAARNFTLLAEVFSAAGYHTATFNGGANVRGDYGFGRGFDAFQVPSVDATADTFELPENESLRFIENHTDEDRFFLLYQGSHLHDPYFTADPYYRMFDPYNASFEERARRDWRAAFEEHGLAPGLFMEFRPTYFGPADRDPALRRHLVARYDGAVRRADAALDSVLTLLEENGRRDDTVVVVTSQHGEQFHEHGEFRHATSLHNEVLRVPLIIHVPGQDRRIDVSQYGSLVDLAPTLIDIVGVDRAAADTGFRRQQTGSSMVPAMDGDPVGKRFLLAAVAGESAYIDVPTRIKYYDADSGPLFYDLSTDFAENSPLPPAPRLRAIADRASRVRSEIAPENRTVDATWPYLPAD